MATDSSQAGVGEAQAVSPASSGKGESQQQASRIQEFFASVTDAEAPELRKHIRTLLEPDFQAQDKKLQKRISEAEKRAKDTEQALQDLGDPEIVDRYRQEQGSLAKAKERLLKKGMPGYMVRNTRTFDDLWEAEEDWTKGRSSTTGQTSGEESDTSDDAAFRERLKRLGVPVGDAPARGATGEVALTGGRPVSPGPRIDKDNIDALWLEGKVSDERYALFRRTGQV